MSKNFTANFPKLYTFIQSFVLYGMWEKAGNFAVLTKDLICLSVYKTVKDIEQIQKSNIIAVLHAHKKTWKRASPSQQIATL